MLYSEFEGSFHLSQGTSTQSSNDPFSSLCDLTGGRFTG